MAFHSNPPLTLYVHLPWCVRKCPYCDFNSHAVAGEVPAERYVDALTADLEQAVPDVWGRPVEAIFIGGGTPSLFPPAAIDRLLSNVRMYLNPPPDIEITLETNPGSAEAARFAGYREAGVNRLSIGVQSFADERLAALGRVHSAADATAAIEHARAAGFERLNIDLMYGLPGQDVAGAVADLERAIATGVDHVSWYQLTLEPNTVFWSDPPALPDEDTVAEMEMAGRERLRAAGFDRYEISAWARGPAARCQHNLNYWTFGDYLGIGAGAHGKLTLAADDAIERRARVRAPEAYLERAAGPQRIAHRRRLSAADAAFEFVLNALRLPEGFSAGAFTERTGVAFAWLRRAVAEAERRGLVERTLEGVRPTPLGLDFHNDLLALFHDDTERWGRGVEAANRIGVVAEPRG